MRNRICFAAFLVLVAPCSAVLGQSYSLLVHSSAGTDGSGIEFGYNWNSGPVAGTGFLSSGGSTSDVVAGGTAATTDTVGNATFESLATNATLNVPADPGLGLPAIPNAANANALAIANDASASVGVAAGGTAFGPSGENGGSSAAYAQVNDTLHVFVSGATATTVTNIPFTFTVDGSYGITTASGNSFGDVQPILDLGQSSFSEIISSGGATGYAPVVGTPSVSGWVSDSFASNTPGLIIFNGTFSVTGSEQDVGVTEVLTAIAGEGTGVDFSNTAALSFDLPSNVSFTSASGVFDTVPVPEPAAISLILAPLVAASIRRRRSPR